MYIYGKWAWNNLDLVLYVLKLPETAYGLVGADGQPQPNLARALVDVQHSDEDWEHNLQYIEID